MLLFVVDDDENTELDWLVDVVVLARVLDEELGADELAPLAELDDKD